MNCKICGTITADFASAEILNAYMVTYYRCPDCGFIQTEEPYWLEEAYSRPINVSDTGIMARNIANARMVSAVLQLCFDTNAQYVDYGGGHGIFVRMMRDRGFDFYRDDKFCTNLFANGFDVSDSGSSRFELLTAFEVFEHFVSPCDELKNLLLKSDNILFTTDIVPVNPPQPTAWWYYGLDHGQHISFYTRNSLQWLAHKNGLDYYCTNNIHLFSRSSKSAMRVLFSLATMHITIRILTRLVHRIPLTEQDRCNVISGRYH